MRTPRPACPHGREAGDEPGAIRVIENLAFVPPAGPVADLIGSLQIPRPAATVGEAARAEIAGLLAGFDRATLDFHKGPNEHLEARIALRDAATGPGEPWWAELSLTNRAKFPITLGPDWMLNPVFMLSFHVEGDRERDYPFLMTVNLDNKRVLRPGETIAVRRTLDVGPLRRVVRGTPQQLQRVSIRAIVDPVQEENGQWRPAATGQELRPVYFNRVPAGRGRTKWRRFFGGLSSVVDSELRAFEVLAELLGERQRAETTKLSYVPEKTPGDRMYQALLGGAAFGFVGGAGADAGVVAGGGAGCGNAQCRAEVPGALRLVRAADGAAADCAAGGGEAGGGEDRLRTGLE